MNKTEETWEDYGTVETFEPESTGPSAPVGSPTLVKSELHWHPSWRIDAAISSHSHSAKLPQFLEMHCLREVNSGTVQLVPPAIDYLIPLAKLWGREMLVRGNNWTEGDGYDLDLLWFLYQKAFRTQAFNKRTFNSVKDLRVSPKAKSVLGIDHILPAVWDGKPLDPGQLLNLGERTAKLRGDKRPKVATKIRLGLYACAKADPLEQTAVETRRLIRQSLFDADRAPAKVDAEVLQQVKMRSGLAFQKHLEEPLAETGEWLTGPRNTFLSQIAKQTKQHGVALDRDAALAALIELAWRGMSMLAECLEVLMRSFAANLPDNCSLSETNRAIYELLYYRQERLGGLPLVFLQHRFSFAREAILDLLEDPSDEQRFGVLNRLLSYYAAMANVRRHADRLVKRPDTQGYRDSDQAVPPDPPDD